MLAMNEPTADENNYREGCPGCRLDEANRTSTGIPYLNFFICGLVADG
jgi:hypothetical protein